MNFEGELKLLASTLYFIILYSSIIKISRKIIRIFLKIFPKFFNKFLLIFEILLKIGFIKEKIV